VGGSLAFAKEGAALIGVHYTVNADAANATVRDIEALGVKAVAVKADLRRGKDAADRLWAQFSEAARTEMGTSALDILVNNAGIAPALPLKQTSEAAFDEVMTINYTPFFLIQAVGDHIRDNGRIINVSTGFTRIAAPTHPAYAASKGALETLTLALAPEFVA
jgi:NAD(P)-dependent dehydrogenase (short-subunit alcohol dehydrogenase family)